MVANKTVLRCLFASRFVGLGYKNINKAVLMKRLHYLTVKPATFGRAVHYTTEPTAARTINQHFNISQIALAFLHHKKASAIVNACMTLRKLTSKILFPHCYTAVNHSIDVMKVNNHLIVCSKCN